MFFTAKIGLRGRKHCKTQHFGNFYWIFGNRFFFFFWKKFLGKLS